MFCCNATLFFLAKVLKTFNDGHFAKSTLAQDAGE
nr:MAG TPA: hypothetical protein [Caudoviricetes sp.]